jgi:hypothetical protein
MVITNNDITQKSYKKLSIQVALNGLSFCVFDLLTKAVLKTESIIFENNRIIEEQLWNVFIEHPILATSFDEILILHNNNLNTLVPNSLFDPNCLKNYLQFNTKIFESDFFAYDEIAPYEIKNVYVPFVNVNNFFLDQYKSFTYKNSNSILIKKIIDIAKNNEEKQIFIHIQKDKFEIVIVKNQELLLFNSFNFNAANDLIYYLLFSCEQLQLNPEHIPVKIIGDCNEDDENFKIIYNYIRKCELLYVNHLLSAFNESAENIRKNFILYHS